MADRVEYVSCPVCGGALSHWLQRSDGIDVEKCTTCAMGVVASRPSDLRVLYEDSYFQSAELGTGYASYDDTAEFCLAWLSRLIPLVAPSGRFIDVGCANGRLLVDHATTHDLFGIEPNERMGRQCEERGIHLVAHDVFSPAVAALAGSFDLVTAVAVLEHLDDLRGAAEILCSLLGPSGLLVFEVPLVTGQADDFWLSSSLEHVFYPTVAGMEHLFGEILRLPMRGSVVRIEYSGASYFGFACHDEARLESVERTWDRIRNEELSGLSPQELQVRVLFELAYRGRSTPQLLEVIGECAEQLTAGLLTRLGALWSRDVQLLRIAEEQRTDFQHRVDGLLPEVATLTAQVDELRSWAAALEEARDYWHNQAVIAQAGAPPAKDGS